MYVVSLIDLVHCLIQYKAQHIYLYIIYLKHNGSKVYCIKPVVLVADRCCECMQLNANLVEENIKDKIRFQSTKFRDMFRKLDVDHNRLIDADELKHALEAWGLQLSDQV